MVRKRFFTSTSKLYSSHYLSGAFQFSVGCFRFGIPVLIAVYIGLILLAGISASVIAIITVLGTSIAAFVMTCVMLCSNATILLVFFFFLFLNETALSESACFLSSSLPYVRLASFYFWHHVMLLTWRMITSLVASLLFTVYAKCELCIWPYMNKYVLYTMLVCTVGIIVKCVSVCTSAFSSAVHNWMNVNCNVVNIYCATMWILYR